MTDLQRAVQHLEAARVGRTSWCYREAQTGFHVLDSEALRDLGRRLRTQPHDAYSLWCADTQARRPDAGELRRYAEGGE